MYAPIALFVYNRPIHTRQTIDALKKNELACESDLVIFSDASKNSESCIAVNEVRDYLKSVTGFKSVSIIEREKNLGLANSVIEGVSKLCKERGNIIVLEDDLITSPFFLDYMNSALVRFQDCERVMQISGYMFPVTLNVDTDAFFLPMTTSWGWATWHRAWQHIDLTAKGYEALKNDANLRNKFNIDSSYNYFRLLEWQLNRKVNSWAVLWYLSVFMRDGLVLFPKQSLVENIGFDGSGTHGAAMSLINSILLTSKVINFPTIEIDNSAKNLISNYLRNQFPKPFLERLIDCMNTKFIKIFKI